MNFTERQSRKDAPLSSKRIVVTGGGGFLGGVVIRKLHERGCRMIVAPPRTRYDLSRAEDIAGLLDRVQPDVLLHLAASVDNPSGSGGALRSFCNNVLMTTQLMEAACHGGVAKMICLGSASSYPAHAPLPLREADLFHGLPEPARLAHGIAKRLPLIQVQLCRRQYGFDCAFLIPTNFYGPGDKFDSPSSYVIPSLIRQFVDAAESGARQVVMRGSGRDTRDFLHVEDCAEGILLALEKYSGAEAVNLASGKEVAISDLARRIARLAGYSGRIVWDDPCGSGSRRVLDVTRARRELGFSPRIGLDEGLRETLEWYRASRAPRAGEIGQPVLLPQV